MLDLDDGDDWNHGYQAGFAAAEDGEPITANPYGDDTALDEGWEAGWEEAMQLEKLENRWGKG